MDRELSLEKTPLENLRSILSDADASAQVPDSPAPLPAIKIERATGVTKNFVRQVIERIRGRSEQFVTPQTASEMLVELITRTPLKSEVFFDNEHVRRLGTMTDGK